jgi:hypothetical protein
VLETPEVAWRGVARLLLEYEEPLAGRSWRVLRRRLEILDFELRWHARRPDEPDVGMAYLVKRTASGRRGGAPSDSSEQFSATDRAGFEDGLGAEAT